ncbi:hypothetical protein NE575_20145, partial [Clostridium sp. SL.3.18]|nr:hypothetical protein [Clostridium sp. SL.3.18]
DEDGKTNYKAGAVYDYTVAGTTADGAQIQIASGIYTTEDGKDNELILPTDNWNYTSIRIAVSRRGEMDSNGIMSGTVALKIRAGDYYVKDLRERPE